MWDLPRPGLKPVSPALVGRFSTTAPPGKPRLLTFSSHPRMTQAVAAPLSSTLEQEPTSGSWSLSPTAASLLPLPLALSAGSHLQLQDWGARFLQGVRRGVNSRLTLIPFPACECWRKKSPLQSHLYLKGQPLARVGSLMTSACGRSQAYLFLLFLKKNFLNKRHFRLLRNLNVLVAFLFACVGENTDVRDTCHWVI